MGIAKGCVQRVTGRSPVFLEMFPTLIAEVEADINNRPLSRSSSDPNDLDPLTLSELLYGRKLLPLEADEDAMQWNYVTLRA